MSGNGARSYPKQVVVKGEEWIVRFTNMIDNCPKTLGLCDPNTKTLYIKTKQDLVNTLATLIHECLHAWEAEIEKDFPHAWIENLDTPVAALLVENCDAFLDILSYCSNKAER